MNDRAYNACYLRQIKTEKYQIWNPYTDKIKTVRSVDFIPERSTQGEGTSECNHLDDETTDVSEQSNNTESSKSSKEDSTAGTEQSNP